ncbi:MAG: putative metal-binding motif-containing protein [Deltaproteobacteria bacterium]|nr:putative metal-binding motif-containing protein [Deltaproteobacteria bacterium]
MRGSPLLTGPGLLLTLFILSACPGGGGGGGIPDGGDPVEDGGSDGGAADAGDPWWEEEVVDFDGDGYSVAEGDCDDEEPEVNPGYSVDLCDHLDNDCDGDTDEDFDGDEWEPNDTTPVELGDLTDTRETLIFGHLFPESDVDRYRFYVNDGLTTYFDIEAWLYGVPADADYALDLYWVEDANGADQGLILSSDREALGGYELINHGGSLGTDDTGWYELEIRSVSGKSCAAPYTLQLVVGSW